MPQIQGAWPLRALGHSPHRFTGLFTVPVADMQVIATVRGPDGKDMQLSIVLPVGITSASSAVVLVLASLAVALFALNRMISGPTVLPKSGVLLKLISTNDGRASLSQFQIVLWTCVVAGSAIYVMVLSGSLIAITSGTLVLLGIAGAAGLLARVPPTAPNPVTANPTAPAPLPPPPPPLSRPPPRAPRWSDMVIVDTGGLSQIDVTRVQMLIFTIISAAFVGIKVATSYEIPDIPEGFLILMGISNGVYLTGRRLAAQ